MGTTRPTLTPMEQGTVARARAFHARTVASGRSGDPVRTDAHNLGADLAHIQTDAYNLGAALAHIQMLLDIIDSLTADGES